MLIHKCDCSSRRETTRQDEELIPIQPATHLLERVVEAGLEKLHELPFSNAMKSAAGAQPWSVMR